MSYYDDAIEQARLRDGDATARAEHLAATIDYLRALPSLDGVTVEDDGFRVLVHVGQARGVAAKAWLAEVDPR